MTANRDTRGRVENSTGIASSEDQPAALNADEEAILNYLDEHGDCPLAQLRGRLRVPRVYLKGLLRGLESDGHLSVRTDYNTIRVKRETADIDGGEAIPDGGTMCRPTIDVGTRDIYRVAQNRRRRETIRLLAAFEGAEHVDRSRYVPVRAIADAISDENGEQIYVTLVQTHLPLLDTLGLVTYHERPQKVEATDDTLSFAWLLDLVDDVAARTDPRANLQDLLDTDLDDWRDDGST